MSMVSSRFHTTKQNTGNADIIFVRLYQTDNHLSACRLALR